FAGLLKPGALFLVFGMPRSAVRAPFGGLAETGAGGVRRLLVPILLNGGFGYENDLRFCSPLAVHPRLLPPIRSRGRRATGRCGGQLPPVQRRTPERGPLPDLAGGRGFLARRDNNHSRTKRADRGRPQSREAPARIPVPRHFVAAVQAAVQPGRLCPGQGRGLR